MGRHVEALCCLTSTCLNLQEKTYHISILHTVWGEPWHLVQEPGCMMIKAVCMVCAMVNGSSTTYFLMFIGVIGSKKGCARKLLEDYNSTSRGSGWFISYFCFTNMKWAHVGRTVSSKSLGFSIAIYQHFKNTCRSKSHRASSKWSSKVGTLSAYRVKQRRLVLTWPWEIWKPSIACLSRQTAL